MTTEVDREPRGRLRIRRFVPVTGAAILKEVFAELAHAGVAVAMAEVKGPVRAMLERTGLSQEIGPGGCSRRSSRRSMRP